MKRAGLIALWCLVPVLASARQFTLSLGVGEGAPLSPHGPNTFATAYRADIGAPEARLLWHWGHWGLGVQAGSETFRRNDGVGSFLVQTAGLSAAYEIDPEEGAQDHLILGVAALLGSGNADNPAILRSWSAPAGELSLAYEWPLAWRLSVVGEGSLLGLLGPQDYDPIAAGALRLWLRSSF